MHTAEEHAEGYEASSASIKKRTSCYEAQNVTASGTDELAQGARHLDTDGLDGLESSTGLQSKNLDGAFAHLNDWPGEQKPDKSTGEAYVQAIYRRALRIKGPT